MSAEMNVIKARIQKNAAGRKISSRRDVVMLYSNVFYDKEQRAEFLSLSVILFLSGNSPFLPKTSFVLLEKLLVNGTNAGFVIVVRNADDDV